MNALERANRARAERRAAEEAAERHLVARGCDCRITVYVEVRSATCRHGHSMRPERRP